MNPDLVQALPPPVPVPATASTMVPELGNPVPIPRRLFQQLIALKASRDGRLDDVMKADARLRDLDEECRVIEAQITSALHGFDTRIFVVDGHCFIAKGRGAVTEIEAGILAED